MWLIYHDYIVIEILYLKKAYKRRIINVLKYPQYIIICFCNEQTQHILMVLMHETNIDMTHNLLKTVISQTKAFTGICQMNFNKEFTGNQSKQI